MGIVGPTPDPPGVLVKRFPSDPHVSGVQAPAFRDGADPVRVEPGDPPERLLTDGAPGLGWGGVRARTQRFGFGIWHSGFLILG